MNEQSPTNDPTAVDSDSTQGRPLTSAQVIGWLAANLTSEVRGQERRKAALERTIAVLGRFVEAVGDDAQSLMPILAIDMLFGGRWEVEHPDLAAAVRAHITLMERQSGRRPTFTVRNHPVGSRRGR